MRKGFFVTATGTDVGKTYVTGLLLKRMRQLGFSAGYYKAALSGAEDRNGIRVPGDADFVRTTAGLTDSYEQMVSYIYDTPVSPHLAARMEGNPVTLSKVKQDYQAACQRYDFVVVEGSGGLICPIRWDEEQHLLLEDIISTLELPILLVSDAALGSINSVALTVAYARQKGIPILGILLNRFHGGDPMEEDNQIMMEAITGVPVLGTIAPDTTDLDWDETTIRQLLEGGTTR